MPAAAGTQTGWPGNCCKHYHERSKRNLRESQRNLIVERDWAPAFAGVTRLAPRFFIVKTARSGLVSTRDCTFKMY